MLVGMTTDYYKGISVVAAEEEENRPKAINCPRA